MRWKFHTRNQLRIQLRYILCFKIPTSKSMHKLQRYVRCVYLHRETISVFSELSKAFERSNLAEKVIFQHVRDIEYRSREIDLSEDVVECFIKEERYSHQGETRAIWSAGDNPPKFFRFKAPDAIRYCRPVLLEDMPDYAPGTDPKLAGAAVIKSINACTRENYLTR